MLLTITGLAALALTNFVFIFRLRNEKKFRKDLCKSYEQERANMRATIDAQRQELNVLRGLISDMQRGWFPATYENSRQKYGASFKRKGTVFIIRERVSHFNVYGVTFMNGETLSYDDLLIKLS